MLNTQLADSKESATLPVAGGGGGGPACSRTAELEIPLTASAQTEEEMSDISIVSVCPCRICQTTKSNEELISPCHCKGSLGKVHLSCLEKWLNMVGRQYCEICSFHFQAVKRRRYGLCESIRLWVRHPSHGMLLRSDLIVAGVLTLFTLGLVIVCLLGMRYFVTEGLRMGVPAFYSQVVILSFMGVILTGYVVTLYLMAKDHVGPWYRWWSRCLVIRITIDRNEALHPPQSDSRTSDHHTTVPCPNQESV